MTFTEIVTEICERLNYTSSTDSTRVGRAVNRLYKEITSSIGLQLTKRETVLETVTMGVSTLTLGDCENVISIFNRATSPYRVLSEVSIDELRELQPYPDNDNPTKWAVASYTSDTTVIEFNCIPQTTFDLYVEEMVAKATLSGSQEPAFPESYHDILVYGVLIDEYDKIEKTNLSTKAERRYEKRMGELRLWIALGGAYKDIYQGKMKDGMVNGGNGGGSGSGGGDFPGSLSGTQTGLITFDRDPSAPFAVTSGSAKVSNLDADLLDGKDWDSAISLSSTLAVTGDITASAKIAQAGTSADNTLHSITGTVTPGAGVSAAPLLINPTITEAGSGTHAILSSVYVQPPTITAGAATVTNGATVYISDAPAGVVSGANYALFADAGNVRFDGILTGRDYSVFSSTTTGTETAWAPTGIHVGSNMVNWAGASTLTVQGISGGTTGQVLAIRNTGASVLFLTHDSGSASVGNKIYCSITSGLTPIAGGGNAVLYHNGTYWVLAGHNQGTWITPTFNAADYTASAGTWTVASGDVTTCAYCIIGKTMHFTVGLITTSVSTTPASLHRIVPGGYTSIRQADGTMAYLDSGVAGNGLWRANPASTTFQFFKNLLAGTWTGSVDNTYISATAVFELT